MGRKKEYLKVSFSKRKMFIVEKCAFCHGDTVIDKESYDWDNRKVVIVKYCLVCKRVNDNIKMLLLKDGKVYELE